MNRQLAHLHRENAPREFLRRFPHADDAHHPPRQDNLPASYAAPVFSSADREFACLCFVFATLVGAPLMLVSLMIGLLISFD